jgi:hypothetical protein
MPNNLDPETQKRLMKEAMKEWLDEQFAAFGRWAFLGLMALAFTGVVYLALVGQGWKK